LFFRDFASFESAKVVIVDDVYTRGTNLGKVATLCANNGLIVSGVWLCLIGLVSAYRRS